jgi:hypothetical protein
LPLWDIERRNFSEGAKYGQLGRVPNGIFDAAAVALGADIIEQNAGNLRRLRVGLETQRDGGRTLPHAADVDHQDDGRLDDAGDIGAAALEAGTATVEHPHHAFDQNQVGAERTLREHLAQRALAQHPGIEIAAGSPAHMRQVRRVDVVGANLEGLHREPAGFEGRDQPSREDRLANVARGPRDDQPGCAYLVQHPCLATAC